MHSKIQMNKILIVGDSFAADWTKKHLDNHGWPNLLSKDFKVINLAQAGISEYKIYKQVTSVDLLDFKFVIVSHTSPTRVHTRRHPIHANDWLHSHADLIFTDIKYHNSKLKNLFNRPLHSAYNWFIHHYDEEYTETIYKMFYNEITKHLQNTKNISITIFKDVGGCDFNYNEYVIENKNYINHVDKKTNRMVYKDIKKAIDESINQ
jgi:hypothetical protein